MKIEFGNSVRTLRLLWRLPDIKIPWINPCLLKLVSAFFFFFFFFQQMIADPNYKKCFLFPLKNFFRSRDIQIFVFLSSTLFLPIGHCFRE